MTRMKLHINEFKNKVVINNEFRNNKKSDPHKNTLSIKGDIVSFRIVQRQIASATSTYNNITLTMLITITN